MSKKTKKSQEIQPSQCWGMKCPACQGKGIIVQTFDSYRVAEEYQDEGPNLLPDKFTRKEALAYVRKYADSSVRHYVIAPNGQIVETT